MGALLAEAGAVVLNGGGNEGLMRATTDGALSKGGRVKVPCSGDGWGHGPSALWFLLELDGM